MISNPLQISQTIENLLHKHDCVVLPDFGGFIVRDSPCNFNADASQIKPFAKNIFFNPHLTQNDGLLVNSIQKQNNLSYSEALDQCKKLIDRIKAEIDSQEQLHFGALGTFFKGQNNVWFAPASRLNLSLDSYGLQAIDVIKINIEQAVSEQVSPKQTISHAIETMADQSPIVSLDVPKRGIKPWLVAASLALIVHFAYLGLETKNETKQQASVLPNIEVNTPQIIEHLATDTETEVPSNLDSVVIENNSSPVETVESIKTQSNNQIATASITEPAVETNLAPAPEPIENFKCIAKYRLEGNAKFHVNDLIQKGQKAKVVQKNQWFEVCIEQ